MNNFGVVELASTKTTSAPGWAYVPDLGPASSSLGQPSNRKRARNAPGPTPSIGDLSARQEAKIRKELEALDKDTPGKDGIPVPSRGMWVDGRNGSERLTRTKLRASIHPT